MLNSHLTRPAITVLAVFVASTLSAQTLTSASASISAQSATLGAAAFAASPTGTALSQAYIFAQSSAEFAPKYPWKKNVVATVFWVGEEASANNLTPNTGSSWDQNWMSNYGGYDDPNRRAPGYRPAGFTPKQNPFYVALPYNDCYDNRATKAEAARVVPWFKSTFKKVGQSVCQNRWIAIRHGDKIAYAQWSDCGPYETTDAKYVFGDAPPTTKGNGGAGLDIAPAVRDYLGFNPKQKCDWRFVDESEVPDGPWRTYGTNNPFSPDWKKDPSLVGGPTVASSKKDGASKPSKSTAQVVRTKASLPKLVIVSKKA
jgi:hypothetical protein